MKSVLIAFLLVIFSFNLKAENYPLKGIVLDKETNNPIPYATLTIKENQEGTLSNMEGRFSLLINKAQSDGFLSITCVGYESIQLSLQEVINDEISTIYLLPKSFILDEVVVKKQSLPYLLEESINITQALIPSQQYYGAYYKEKAYLDKQLYKFSDASITYAVNDEKKKTKTDLYILESRLKQDSVVDEEKWRNDVESLIDPQKAVKDYYNLDYLKAFISKKGIQKFNFTSEQNDQIIKIIINPKEDVRQYLPNGIVYINAETKRIIRVGHGYLTHLKYMPKVNLLVLAMSYEESQATILYDEGEKAFMRYCNISQEVRFKVGKKKGLLGSNAEIVFHQLQDNLPDLTDKNYSKINIYRSGNRFTSDFWKDDNFLVLTEKELEILD